MKIAMLTSDYLPNIGGIASHIYELSKALIVNGHEVEVWVWDRKGLNPPVKEMGEVPVRLMIEKGRLVNGIESLVTSFSPNVIHVHTLDQLLPVLTSIRKRHSFTAVWTNHSSRYLRKIGSPIWRWKLRYQAAGLDGILATSQERLEKSYCLGIPKEACKYIPNGVDSDKYSGISKDHARDALHIPRNAFVLLYVGRFAPIKGVSHLAQALLTISFKIPNILCVMCGNMDGDRESENIRSFVAANALDQNVRMEGFIRNDLLGPYLAACDALVLPSLMEATSISALEAMSVGRPVIGSRVGGIPDLITEEVTGVMANPGDSEDLARAIVKFWRMSGREEMGVNAKNKVLDAFTWKKIAETTTEFYVHISRPR